MTKYGSVHMTTGIWVQNALCSVWLPSDPGSMQMMTGPVTRVIDSSIITFHPAACSYARASDMYVCVFARFNID